MTAVPLGTFLAQDVDGLDPRSFPEEEFELWSVPAYETGTPEVRLGDSIGSAKKQIHPNDVLLSRIVPHIRRAWVVGQNTGRQQIASSEWIVFRSEGVLPAYLRHFLLSDVFHAQFMKTVAGVGGSLLRARPDGVALIELPLPNCGEQRRIAAMLDQADALRRRRQKTIDACYRLGQSVFAHMFDRSSIGRRPLSELIEIETGLVSPTDKQYEDLPHIGPEHIARDSGELLPYRTAREDGVTSGKFLFSPEAIIFSKIRPYLNKVALAPSRGLCSADAYALKARNGVSQRLFVWFLLRQPEFLKYAESVSNRANIPKLNRVQLLSYLAPAPNIALQQEFERRIVAVEKVKGKAKEHLARVEKLFVSLQETAFADTWRPSHVGAARIDLRAAAQ